MIGKRLRARLFWSAFVLCGLVQIAACQVSADQVGASSASLQGLADAVRTFIGDFARQVLQAAVL